MSELCAVVRVLRSPNEPGTLRRIAERNGVAHDGRTDTANRDEYNHYYVGTLSATEAFVREARRAGFDAQLRTG